VWEWVHDWYVSDWSTKPVTDPAGPPSGTLRACRGGGYWDDPEYLRSGRRGSASHDTQEGWLGLRCVRSLP
jgi:sulfatase modifying factor 1